MEIKPEKRFSENWIISLIAQNSTLKSGKTDVYYISDLVYLKFATTVLASTKLMRQIFWILSKFNDLKENGVNKI